jgi:hypothetical protein
MVLTPFQERGYRQNAVGFDRDGGKDYLGVFYRFGGRWAHPNENRVLMPWLDGGVVGHFPAFEGRRLWGMMVCEAGPGVVDKPVQHAGSIFGAIHRPHVKHGETPLDKVKDWVLEWNPPANAAWPRLYYRPERLAEMKREYPDLSDETKQLIARDRVSAALLTDNSHILKREFEHHLAELRQSVLDFLNGGHNTPNTYTHRCQEVVRHSTRALDIALAEPSLTPEQRTRALAIVAFLAYKTSDRDYWPYRSYAGGPANPNMMSIACHALASCAAMAPGHPKQKEWLDTCARLVCADIETSIGPQGTWLESPGYQGAGNTPINQTVLILANAGGFNPLAEPRFGRRLVSASSYFANLLTPPDPRFENRRMPMALGDNVPFFNNHYVYLAHRARRRYPQQAGHSVWCWRQMGRPVGRDALLLLHEHVLDDSIPPTPISGGSVAFPAFGAMLRHGFGAKHETFLTFRHSNFAYGHYDEDQGSFSLFAKGAPLCLDWIDYSPGEAEHHNRVDYAEQYPWLVPAPDHITLHDEADYIRVHETPRNQAPGGGIDGAAWIRQLILVKDATNPGDATYLVVRDLVNTPAPSTWNLWTLAKKGGERIDKNAARLEGRFGVDLSLLFYRPLERPLGSTLLQHRTRSYLQMNQDQTRIQAASSRGGDYGVVLYPLRRGIDREPKVRQLPSGALEINWGGGRRHLVFLFPEPRSVQQGGVAFTGRAATVKLQNGRRVLVPLECDELRYGAPRTDPSTCPAKTRRGRRPTPASRIDDVRPGHVVVQTPRRFETDQRNVSQAEGRH